MREFFFGDAGGTEEEFQQWLEDHPDGLVISLNTNAAGKYTLHHADCRTVSYPLTAAGHQSRSGMICCEEMREVEQWLCDHEDIRRVGVSRDNCPQCS